MEPILGENMYKVAKKLLDENKITQAEFDSVKDLTKEAVFKFKTAAELLKELEQTAKHSKNSYDSPIHTGLKALGIAAIGGTLADELVRRARHGLAMRTAYDDMIKKNPMLSEYPKEEVEDYYSVIKTFSPKAAANPLVAGALVNKMIQFGGVDHKLVQDIANIQGPQKDVLVEIAAKAGGAWASPTKDELGNSDD